MTAFTPWLKTGRPSPAGPLPLTPRSKHILALAEDEARLFGDGYIGTEHILLAIAREGGGIAAGILEAHGLNLDVVRRDLFRILGGQQP